MSTRYPTISLSEQQRQRYKAQLQLPGMSEEKLGRILRSTCLCIAGGEPLEYAVQHLVRAGVGAVHIFGERGYLEPFERWGGAINPDVNVELHQLLADADPGDNVFSGVNVVIESALDWQFKLRISDTCMRLGIPLIHCGSSGLRFQLFSMVPGKSACLRCALPVIGIDDVPLHPVPRDTFDPVAACAGSLMALEAIKLICGLGVIQGNELWKVDGLSGEIEIVRGLDRRHDCPDCGRHR